MKKNIFLFFIAALFLVGCMKDYDDNPIPVFPTSESPILKVSGATLVGDTAYAAPNVFIKFWLDELSMSVDNYSFSWNLGDGNYSNATSPEKKYEIGSYYVSVSLTPLSGGSVVTRNIVLIIDNEFTFETTLVLLSATLVSGNNYDYSIAMRSTAIYNYTNTSGDPWIRGDFTSWEFSYLNETTTINGILYLIAHVILPADNQSVQRFVYGKGSVYAYSPESRYWIVTGSNEGVFEVYLTNGQMSSAYIGDTLIPGDNGDPSGGTFLPTIRTSVLYSGIPMSDSLRVYVNYSEYANGTKPFISRMLSNSNWEMSALVLMSGDYLGWGYQTFAINNLSNGLYWRFGPNLNTPNDYGNMSNSKFYLSGNDMLGLQINSLKSVGVYQISPVIN